MPALSCSGPRRKFYDLELYEKQQAAKAVRKGTKLEVRGGKGGPGGEGTWGGGVGGWRVGVPELQPAQH